VVAALDSLRELDLLRRGQQVDFADVLQEELERIGRDLRAFDVERVLLGLLDLNDLDVQLLEQTVELVDLPRVEGQLVERERDLLCGQLPRLAPDLKELPRLLDFENTPRRLRTCCLLPSAQLRSPSRLLTVLAVPEKSTCVNLDVAVFQLGSVCVYGPKDPSYGP
jgi:hypothetical protein